MSAFVIWGVAGAVLVFVVATMRMQLDEFNALDSIRATRLSDLTSNRYEGLRKVLLAVTYDRWMRVLQAATSFTSLGLLALSYIVLLLALSSLGMVQRLEDGLLSYIPTIIGGVLAGLSLYLKDLRERIKK